jgi:hypothetical protein
MSQKNGWDSYQKLVLAKLEDHSGLLDLLSKEVSELRNKDITELKVEIAMLKIKAGMWGAAAGMIPAGVAVALVWLGK